MMKRLGMWGCAVGLMMGCAAAKQESRPPDEAPRAGQLAEAKTPSSRIEELPECPSDIPAEERLQGNPDVRPLAREWVPSLSASDVGFSSESPVERLFQQELTLAGGPVEVVGLGSQEPLSGRGMLVLARPHARGYCVVNVLNMGIPGALTVSLADSWRSADSRFALLLLKESLEVAGRPETRWITVGTDGHRAWIALNAAPHHELIAPKVTFFRNGKDLYLDIHQRYVTRLSLGADGHFIVPPKAK